MSYSAYASAKSLLGHEKSAPGFSAHVSERNPIPKSFRRDFDVMQVALGQYATAPGWTK